MIKLLFKIKGGPIPLTSKRTLTQICNGTEGIAILVKKKEMPWRYYF